MAKKSLVSEQQNGGTALAIPASDAALSVGDMQPGGGKTPYVVFFSQKSQNAAKLVASLPGLQEPEPVLIRGDLPPVKLPLLKFHMLASRQYAAELDDSGQVVSAKPGRPEYKSDLAEMIETLCLVYLPDGKITAARITFKRGMTAAAHTAKANFDLAKTAEWGGLSPEHKESLTFPHPWGRFFVEAIASKRTSKGKGRKYGVTDGTAKPSGEAEFKALDAYFKEEENKKAFADVKDSYLRRIAEIDGKVSAE